MFIPKFGIYIPEFGICMPKSETEICCKDNPFFLKHQIIIELSLMLGLFIRLIIGLEDLDGVVVVELDLERGILCKMEGCAGFIP